MGCGRNSRHEGEAKVAGKLLLAAGADTEATDQVYSTFLQ